MWNPRRYIWHVSQLYKENCFEKCLLLIIYNLGVILTFGKDSFLIPNQMNQKRKISYKEIHQGQVNKKKQVIRERSRRMTLTEVLHSRHCYFSLIPSPWRGIYRNLEPSHCSLPIRRKFTLWFLPFLSLDWREVEMTAKKLRLTPSNRSKGYRAAHWIRETVSCPEDVLHWSGICFSPPWLRILKSQKSRLAQVL